MLQSWNQSKQGVATAKQTSTASQPVFLPVSLHHRDAGRGSINLLSWEEEQGWQASGDSGDKATGVKTLCQMAEPRLFVCLLSCFSLWSKNCSCFATRSPPGIGPGLATVAHSSVHSQALTYCESTWTKSAFWSPGGKGRVALGKGDAINREWTRGWDSREK